MAVVGQLVVIVSESVGGAFFVEGRYYESDGNGPRLKVTDRTLIHDSESDGFAGCLQALRAL